MKTLIFILMLIPSLATAGTSLVLSGFSWHEHEYIYADDGSKQRVNGKNYGLGFEHLYVSSTDTVYGAHTGEYIDSRGNKSSYTGVSLADRIYMNSLAIDYGVSIDYHDRKLFKGIAPLPYAAVQYRGVGTNLLWIPRVSYEGAQTINTIYIQFKVRVDG